MSLSKIDTQSQLLTIVENTQSFSMTASGCYKVEFRLDREQFYFTDETLSAAIHKAYDIVSKHLEAKERHAALEKKLNAIAPISFEVLEENELECDPPICTMLGRITWNGQVVECEIASGDKDRLYRHLVLKLTQEQPHPFMNS